MMHRVFSKVAQYFINHGMIKEADSEWFRYGLEKRISTICVMIPFFLVAISLTNFTTAVSFFLSFYTLRSKTNGLHAKTFLGCLFISLLLEAVFCIGIYRLITMQSQFLIYLLCIPTVFKLAPFVHPNLPISDEAKKVICRQSRIRVCTLSLLSFVASLTSLIFVFKGLIMGLSMATLMLSLPYITGKGGECNGKR